ncbi:MAG: hypothetical protein JWO71_554 [Candidatus Acidoferrum typicum]|nr:hypothetical protein [Candidatus Acidoferrum typicum]
MELQKKIRIQMMMVGLGAALFMAGSARAQQDMDPTYFDVNPGTPAFSKAAVIRVAQSSPAANENGSTQNVLTLAVSKGATLEARVARMAFVDAGVALILFGGILSIVLYALAATRRERNLGVPRVNARTAPFLPRRLSEGSTAPSRPPGIATHPTRDSRRFFFGMKFRSRERRRKRGAFPGRLRQSADARSRSVPGT